MIRIGDYVKCINNFDCYGLNVGEIYKIENIHPSFGEYLIKFPNGEKSYYCSYRFVKINRKEKLERILNYER